MTVTILDQTCDDGRLRHLLEQLVAMPSWAKSATVAGVLPADCWADQARRRFPCHDAGNTWLSTAAFLVQQERYPAHERAVVDERLAKMASFHGISCAITALRDKVAELADPVEAEVLTDRHFALVLPGDPPQRRYPLRNHVEVKTAAARYLDWRDQMPWELRQQYAGRVLDRANELGVKLDEEEVLARAAGRGLCAAKEAASMILDRVRTSRKGSGPLSTLQVSMLKLARVCLEKPAQARSPDGLARLAGIVDSFDRACGLVGFYRDGLERPEDVLFGVTKSAAESLLGDVVECASGVMYKLAELEHLPARTVRDGLGELLASQLSVDGIHVSGEKCASVLPKLSGQDAWLFDQLCQQHGVPVWGQTAKTGTQVLDQNALAGLAAARRQRYPERF
jgi:hypothetical protein